MPNQPAGPLLPVEPSRRGRYIPAVLDAIIPGLGHLFAGRRRRALLFLAPILIALVAAVIIAITSSPARLAASLVESEVLWALLAFQAFLLIWRILAVGSSLTAPGLPKLKARDAIPVALHPAGRDRPAGLCRATGPRSPARRPRRSSSTRNPPVAVGPSVAPEPDPSNLETAEPSPSGSLDPSLLPSASAPVSSGSTPSSSGSMRAWDGDTYLTDTMIVVSLDPVTETVSMVSIPRDMVDVPLADGRKYHGQDQRTRCLRPQPSEAVPRLERDWLRRPARRARQAPRARHQVLRRR